MCLKDENIPNSTEMDIDVTRATYKNLDVACKKHVLMIIGMWTRIEVHLILGKDSQEFTLLKEKPPMGYICGPGR